MKGMIFAVMCMGFVSVGYAAIGKDRASTTPSKVMTCEYDRHGNEVNCREMGKAEETPSKIEKR